VDIDGLDLDDRDWTSLKGGYRTPFDPTPALRALNAGPISDGEWTELVTNLYHQGDVGEASYAVVPHLVRIYADRRSGAIDTYSFVAMVELARGNGRNPPLPDRFSVSYYRSFAKLASIGLQDLLAAIEPALVSYILAVVALEKGQRSLGQFAALFDEGERGNILQSAGWA